MIVYVNTTISHKNKINNNDNISCYVANNENIFVVNHLSCYN